MKQSEIERIKLKANYLNGLSIGLMISGFLVPYLVFTQNMGTIVEKISLGSALTFSDKANSIATLVAFTMAYTGAKRLRRLADDTVKKLDGFEEELVREAV